MIILTTTHEDRLVFVADIAGVYVYSWRNLIHKRNCNIKIDKSKAHSEDLNESRKRGNDLRE
jgi:hypothetical protein